MLKGGAINFSYSKFSPYIYIYMGRLHENNLSLNPVFDSNLGYPIIVCAIGCSFIFLLFSVAAS